MQASEQFLEGGAVIDPVGAPKVTAKCPTVACAEERFQLTGEGVVRAHIEREGRRTSASVPPKLFPEFVNQLRCLRLTQIIGWWVDVSLFR